MMKKPKWGSWLVAGALAVNLLLPAMAGAGTLVGKLEPIGPREGDPDTPGGAQNLVQPKPEPISGPSITIFVPASGQMVALRLRLTLLLSLLRNE